MVLLTDDSVIFSGLKHGSTMLHWQAEKLGYSDDELLPANYCITAPDMVLSILFLNTTSHPIYGKHIKEAILENAKNRKIVVYTRTPELAIYSAIAESIMQLHRSRMFSINSAKKYNLRKATLGTIGGNNLFLDPISNPVVEKYTEIGMERAFESSLTQRERFDFNSVNSFDHLTSQELEEYFYFWLNDFLPHIITYDRHILGCIEYSASILKFFDFIKHLNQGEVPSNYMTLNLDTYSVDIDFTKHLAEQGMIFPEFRVQGDVHTTSRHSNYSLRKYHSVISKVFNETGSTYLRHRIAEYSYFKNLLDTQYNVEYTYDKFVSLKEK